MFIQTQETQNPNSLKFLPGKRVSNDGPYEFLNANQTQIPLLKNILSINGVTGIFLSEDFLSINKIEDEKIINGFKNRQVAVVAGFQGVGSDGRITTIGRGGSDNTAVFLASALNAERCDIYTDVNGVYTTDPRMADNVKRLNKISYEEMIEMSSQGAKVIQTSSVESAINHNVKVQVRSTFHPDDMGTVISDEVMNNESKAVSGVAYSKDEAKITVIGLVDQPGIAATIFNALSNLSLIHI